MKSEAKKRNNTGKVIKFLFPMFLSFVYILRVVFSFSLPVFNYLHNKKFLSFVLNISSMRISSINISSTLSFERVVARRKSPQKY